MGRRVDADMALSGAYDHIILATGARWRADGVGHACHFPVAADPDAAPLTPDDVFRRMRDKDAKWPEHVTIYDDEHYYTASLIADYLISRQCQRDIRHAGRGSWRYGRTRPWSSPSFSPG